MQIDREADNLGASLASNWGLKSAPFPMAKSDVVSQLYVEKFTFAFTFWSQEAIFQSNWKIKTF